ncbi:MULTISPECIES: cation:proton antiporter domain-containing protein [Alteromonas]|uniref:Cation:proton antiporter n=2 Tax=Alteromonas stellipolaris TaxID=233316 RepID=A0AAW7Z3U0_9ALTE|nr:MULTISPECIES: cation:proton antiporter [Alteromonas]ALM91534.1 Glutathione-regulated potassium-efflux system protein KefB [Alteromonas stellipolaris LMG 21856]MBZ2161722.1 cation:proton antiporter [Alteromonas stellipolaris]MDO6534149.1 cation:proton antiporter [Alteromonas stellipolaris]MDO6536956.1 cation:proton antiporter [Alteromonas stellipolaris]MDO6579490.1 cation:proton antiporter [Alteromonas stellipolaris]
MSAGFLNVIALMFIAVCSVAIFKRIHLPPILAYLFAGILAGPQLFALFAHPQEMHLLAETGIVFLLFSLGLEFSLPKLVAMRSLVFGVGVGQMLLTTAVFTSIPYLFGLPISASIIIGGALALSSTAIVIKQATEMGILNNRRTQLAVSILLFQDLAVVPFLIAIPLLAQSGEVSIAFALGEALLKGIFVIAFLMSVGKWVLPWVFREIAKTRTDELFVLTTILIALLAGGLTYYFGLSMALGAFLAGMMLGESQYKYQLEADIRPFRDILMGLFFVTVGMQLDINVLWSNFFTIVLGVVGLMIIKILMVRMAAAFVKTNPLDAWSAGIKLCQIGEFSFVIAALATTYGVLTTGQSSLIVSMGVLSMALTPWLMNNSLVFAKRIVANKSEDNAHNTLIVDNDLTNHVVICGFGRVGQSVARMLKMEGIAFIAIDMDPVRVHESRNAGEPVLFGDASQKDILSSANVEKAKLILVTFDQPDKAKQVISGTHQIDNTADVMVRTKRDYQLDGLYSAGANQVVPELQEGSLMLISQVLHYAGVPMSRILKRVRAERKGRYDHLHGFYPGETTEISYGTEDKLEFIHAVVLSEHAACMGSKIKDIDFARMRVNVRGLRRNGTEVKDPDHEAVLQPHDVLVIAGKPRRVERAERKLLEGS